MNRGWSLVSALCAPMLVVLSACDQPYLVKDIKPNEPDLATGAWGLVRAGEFVYFSARDPRHGTELWRSDGTVAGTGMVKDIVAGPTSSGLTILGGFGDLVFFAVSGVELWRSDGTDDGTVLLRRFSDLGTVGSFGGSLFFGADHQLWKSDGTPSGTVLVKDTPSEEAYYGSPSGLTVVGNRLFFRTTGTPKLWMSDGTTEGTVVVKDFGDFRVTYTGIGGLVDLEGTLLFAASDGLSGFELWKSDGTEAGTVLVRDIRPGVGDSNLSEFRVLNGTLLFTAITATEGAELWRSDGTEAGTVMIRDIVPGVDGSDPSSFCVMNDALYFSATRGPANERELWRSDGTAAGTLALSDVLGVSTGLGPSQLTAVHNTLFYAAASDVGTEVWHTDGTPGGTGHTELEPGPGSSYPEFLTPLGDAVFFRAWSHANGEFVPGLARATSTGAARIDLPVPGSGSSMPTNLARFGPAAFFTAEDGIHGRELWKTDGTKAGTVLVRDIFTGPTGSSPGRITIMDGFAYFGARDAIHGVELWRTDGTATGISLVKDINPGTASGFSTLFPIAVLNGNLFFCAGHPVHGTELWRSDGTPAGTVLVKDAAPGNVSSCGSLTKVGGALFFVAPGPDSFTSELWKSDGTEAGTVRVLGALAPPSDLVDLDGTLFFTTHGEELWRSDGTADGTVLVTDLGPGLQSSTILGLKVAGSHLYFSADDGEHGRELWVSDGTAEGTQLLKDIVGGLGSSNPSGVVPFGDGALFFASDDTVGPGLWRTDGSMEGTRRVIAGLSPISEIFVTHGAAFFGATDHVAGYELWRSDGTTAGTAMVADIVSGDRSSSPQNFGLAGSHLVFSAEDDEVGRELWALELNRPPVAAAGPDVTVGPQTAVTLDGSASSDPDGDALAYQWRNSAGGVVGNAAVVPLPPLTRGLHDFTLIVSDGKRYATDMIRVTVSSLP